MKLRCLAVDDEPLALQQIGEYIKRTPILELVSLCARPHQAADLLAKNPVDLLFADIEMPDLSGMDLIKSLPNPPLVIFTTAYDSYAVESYRVNAVDYLLKPFSHAEFLQASQKALELFQQRQSNPITSVVADPLADVLFVKADYQSVRIDIPDITYIEGMKDYVRIHRPPHKAVMTLASLKSLEERLLPKGFLRIHRSYVIQLSKISRLEKGLVVLQSGEQIPIGDLFRDGLINRIHNKSLES